MKDETIHQVIELAMAIQQIPAPTFEEGERAEFVRAKFSEAGLSDVDMDLTGNVYGRWAGGSAPPLIVSAHLDTVFAHGTNLRLTRDPSTVGQAQDNASLRTGPGRIHGPGIGDNSMGVAALLGLAWTLREQRTRPHGDIWFVANTCEEGLGDLRGMRAVVERFGANVTGYLVIEGAALGHIYHRAVGVHRYRITVRTAGGHAWSDYGKPSAVHELAALAARIASLNLPATPRTTLNVGRITGGTSVNTLAAEASLELDMRSEAPAALAELIQRVDALIEAANRPGVRVEAEVIGHRPAGEIPVHHPLIELALACTRRQGIEPTLIGGSTDANVPFSLGLPAVVMGVTTGGGAHTPSEYVNVEPVAQGMRALMEFVTTVWGQ